MVKEKKHRIEKTLAKYDPFVNLIRAKHSQNRQKAKFPVSASQQYFVDTNIAEWASIFGFKYGEIGTLGDLTKQYIWKWATLNTVQLEQLHSMWLLKGFTELQFASFITFMNAKQIEITTLYQYCKFPVDFMLQILTVTNVTFPFLAKDLYIDDLTTLTIEKIIAYEISHDIFSLKSDASGATKLDIELCCNNIVNTINASLPFPIVNFQVLNIVPSLANPILLDFETDDSAPVVAISLDYTPISTKILKVQGTFKGSDASGGTTIIINLDSTPTNGNVLIACIGGFGTGVQGVSSIVQTGVTWTQQKANRQPLYGNSYCAEIWLGVIGYGASSSLTINLLEPTYVYTTIGNVAEYSGIKNTGFLDKTASDYYIHTYTNSTGETDTTSQTKELWIGVIWNNGVDAMGDVSEIPPIENGFTQYDGVAVTGTLGGAAACSFLEKIVSSIGTAKTSITLQRDYESIGCIATFKGT